MKIWTVTTDIQEQDTHTDVFLDVKVAKSVAAKFVSDRWTDDLGDMPANWVVAYDLLGSDEHLWIEEHEVELPVDRSPQAEAYRAAVCRTDELEVDDDAIVSMGTDPGAFVAAWVWVTNEEAGICDECGEVETDCGCADKAEEPYPESDWQYEVSNGDTKLGLAEWRAHQVEMNS